MRQRLAPTTTHARPPTKLRQLTRDTLASTDNVTLRRRWVAPINLGADEPAAPANPTEVDGRAKDGGHGFSDGGVALWQREHGPGVGRRRVEDEMTPFGAPKI